MPFGLLDRWLSPAPDWNRVNWIAETDFAHRGLHGIGVPENSRAAFERAREQGYGIELDVQRSSDGHCVVFHDDTLDRLAEPGALSGPVNRLTSAQLAQVRLLGSAGSGETIPTLRQVLAQIAGKVPVLIEVKSRDDNHVAGRCLAVRRVLEGYTGAHAVMSFDPRVARWFSRHSPHTVRGLIVSEGERRALPGRIGRRLALWHAKPDFLAYDINDLPSRFAAAQRARGLPLATWTVRSAEQAERAARFADADIFEIEPGAGPRA
ncbi:glycerophosphodiester phosphodiesterase [Novosphingobium sp. 1949]|uniref:Glycerophosphodiester phosphodiesterase n=1 Tax=Novosphingobium organovorum TaxID=2930092 RepID=A0ABT0BGL5_9SPHN|nr:glycerophosphodiester phosphodiesterase family protein [Novosphingobium organovorum]MCJ2184212.1 glycerophosphodiester phosphodiesterase [Novosphingobium organovorum]